MNSARCSYSNYVLPGFPSPVTWERNDETPAVFYGRSVHYSPGSMWATALTRGFDREYLVQFDCLASGFFINDIGRIAWILYGGAEFRCLVVDNARPRDLYNTVVLNREAVEVEFGFSRDILGDVESHNGHPFVLVAYQIDRPDARTWLSAQRLDDYLFGVWESSYYEPRGWVQIRPDQQAWFRIDGTPLGWTRVPGCLYCLDGERFSFDPERYEYYEVVAGDSLDRISKKLYGYSHPRFWEAIYQANKTRMRNPYFIKIGQLLKIPVYTNIEN